MAIRAIDIMTAEVATVRPDAPVEQVARRLVELGVNALPVVDDDDNVLGIVSEGDLIRRPELGTQPEVGWSSYLLDSPGERAVRYAKIHGREARDVMSAPIVSVHEHATLAEIAEIFDSRGIKRLPVLRDGKLVGIVTRASVLLGFLRPE